jgi:hypothetical protein
MRGCLEKSTLIALANGELTETAAAVAENHLIKCRRCAASLAKLPVHDGLLERLRDLERARAETASALSNLKQLTARIDTTLFPEG